jgi:tetratricopeptide (TPR) repeat protein
MMFHKMTEVVLAVALATTLLNCSNSPALAIDQHNNKQASIEAASPVQANVPVYSSEGITAAYELYKAKGYAEAKPAIFNLIAGINGGTIMWPRFDRFINEVVGSLEGAGQYNDCIELQGAYVGAKLRSVKGHCDRNTAEDIEGRYFTLSEFCRNAQKVDEQEYYLQKAATITEHLIWYDINRYSDAQARTLDNLDKPVTSYASPDGRTPDRADYDDTKWFADSYNSLVRLMILQQERNEFAKWETTIKRCLAIYEKGGPSHMVDEMLGYLATAQDKQGKFDDEEKTLLRILSGLSPYPGEKIDLVWDIRAKAYVNLAEFYERQKKYASAVQAYRKVVELYDANDSDPAATRATKYRLKIDAIIKLQ